MYEATKKSQRYNMLLNCSTDLQIYQKNIICFVQKPLNKITVYSSAILNIHDYSIINKTNK